MVRAEFTKVFGASRAFVDSVWKSILGADVVPSRRVSAMQRRTKP